MKLKNYFDRIVLISLKRRPDRLLRARRAITQVKWPFRNVEVFEAIDGTLAPPPEGWQSGPGAWGCLRSHQAVLERAIVDGVDTLLVLEDDVCFADNFASDIAAFLLAVPDDWDQLMIGGQHKSRFGYPPLVAPNVYRCTGCERTHCYAVRGRFMRKLYQRWTAGGRFNGEVHCDWIMARDQTLQFQHKVYAPGFFLAGQYEDRSDIMCGIQPQKFWNPPGPHLPVIFVEGPAAVVAELREHGFHFGHNIDAAAQVDRRLEAVLGSVSPVDTTRLREVITELQWEVASDSRLLCAVWHPKATADIIRAASLWKVYEVRASSVREAVRQLPRRFRRSQLPRLGTPV